MRSSHLLGFFLALLPAAAISHDAYMAYSHPEMGDFIHAFRFSDVGWMWANYHQESFNWAKDNLDPDFWQALLDPLLSQSTALVAALPLALLIIASFVHKAVGGLEMQAAGKSPAKTKKLKYRRK